jgi:hypothetical protein
VAVLLLPLVAADRAAGGLGPPGDTSPVPWLLTLLAVAVGILLRGLHHQPRAQAWFAATEHRAARNPYVLYAAQRREPARALAYR